MLSLLAQFKFGFFVLFAFQKKEYGGILFWWPQRCQCLLAIFSCVYLANFTLLLLFINHVLFQWLWPLLFRVQLVNGRNMLAKLIKIFWILGFEPNILRSRCFWLQCRHNSVLKSSIFVERSSDNLAALLLVAFFMTQIQTFLIGPLLLCNKQYFAQNVHRLAFLNNISYCLNFKFTIFC